MVIVMKTITKLLVADFMAFFDALSAHAIVPIVPAWLIYAYAVPIEFMMVYGFEKVVNTIRRWL